jgi:hypothetical protein
MKPINKALRRAKAIPLANSYKEKQKAVHAWVKAIKELLAN